MTQSNNELEILHDHYTKTAANIISYYEDDQRKEKLKELRDIVQENCLQHEKPKAVENIKNDTLSLHENNNNNADTDMESIINTYNQGIAEINIDVTRHPRLIEFDKHVEALLDNVKDSKSDQNEELLVSGGYINVIDPISKKRIVDPVKNSICGHTYDRETITEMLKINKNTRCPVMGCRSKEFVTLAHLRADIVTKAYLEKND